jgi:diguanylate cyclase (GGDEF)-like protein/PAS domain S-box-containing protein
MFDMTDAPNELATELRKFRILFDLATAMTSDQSLNDNLNLIVEMSRTILSTDVTFLALRDEVQGDVYTYCHSGLQSEALKTFRTPFSKGLGGLVTTSHTGRIVADYANDPAFTPDPAGLTEGLVSGVAIPIQIGPKNFGVLYAFNHARTSFTKNDLDTLSLIGNIASVEIGRHQIEEKLRASEEKYRLLMDAVPDPVIVFDQEGKVTFLNRVFTRVFGWELHEIIGKPLNFIPDESRAESMEALKRMRRGNVAIALETRRITKFGKTLDIQGSISQFKDRNGQFAGSIVILRDVTDIKNAERALRESNQRLSLSVREQENRARELSVLNSMNELLQACYSEADAYMVMASVCKKLFPKDAGFLSMRDEAGDRFTAVAHWGDEAFSDIDDYGSDACWSLRLGKTHCVEDPSSDLMCTHPIALGCSSYLCLPITTSSGILGVLHVFYKCHEEEDLTGENRKRQQSSKRMMLSTMLEHYALSLVNLKLRETLKSQSIRDPLTGLFNRRYLDESMRREMFRSRRHGTPTGIIMIDVDHFKAVNDTHGHEAGDAILKGLATFLQQHTRNEDILCRYGGEEFILLMPESDLNNTRKRAEQLCEQVRIGLRINHQGVTHKITISLGVAAFPDQGPTIEAAQNVADAALYRAKEQGRDRVVVASE